MSVHLVFLGRAEFLCKWIVKKPLGGVDYSRYNEKVVIFHCAHWGNSYE